VPFGPFLLFRLLMSAPFHAAAIDDPVMMEREAAAGPRPPLRRSGRTWPRPPPDLQPVGHLVIATLC
jgi:hypothetical protein